jgi:hypothetical protein
MVSSDTAAAADFGDQAGSGNPVKRWQAFRAAEGLSGGYLNVDSVNVGLRTHGGGAPSPVTLELARAGEGGPLPPGVMAETLGSGTQPDCAFQATAPTEREGTRYAGLLPGALYAVSLGQLAPQAARYAWCTSGPPGVAGLGFGRWDGAAYAGDSAAYGTGALYLLLSR